MNAFELHAADLGSLEAEYGTGRPTLTWNGMDYPCLAGTRISGKTLELGGWLPSNPLRVVIRTSLFTGDWPEPQQTVTYTPSTDGTAVTLQIDSVFLSPGSQQITLALIDRNKGA